MLIIIITIIVNPNYALLSVELPTVAGPLNLLEKKTTTYPYCWRNDDGEYHYFY